MTRQRSWTLHLRAHRHPLLRTWQASPHRSPGGRHRRRARLRGRREYGAHRPQLQRSRRDHGGDRRVRVFVFDLREARGAASAKTSASITNTSSTTGPLTASAKGVSNAARRRRGSSSRWSRRCHGRRPSPQARRRRLCWWTTRKATAEPDTPEWLLDHGRLPDGKKVSDATTREIAEAAKAARAAQALLRKRGAQGATARAVRRGGETWLHIELREKDAKALGG